MNAFAVQSVSTGETAAEIRVRGRVQGVGFRPTVWRIARDFALRGDVLNDAEGVRIRAAGSEAAIAGFLSRLAQEPPPLASIEAIERRDYAGPLPADFRILDSVGGASRTQVTPDAALCRACVQDVLDPSGRRTRYPFTNCTHCGPRLSIVEGVPYDRAATTMAPFPLCEACRAEYARPSDRRFHAEAIACHACGPKAVLVRLDGRPVRFDQDAMRDDVDAAADLIANGEIVAIKGIGGYQLACDATNEAAVQRLRRAKRREAKPFALMARDLDIVRRTCWVGRHEAALLTSPEAPIVLLDATGPERLPDAVAPGLTTLGFMLPTTPLHLLVLERIDRPVVMTSGNVADEPQVIADDEAKVRLAAITPHALVHDRAIASRVDDSLVRVMAGEQRILRRARGYAPAPIRLPEGFEDAPQLLAFGGELKATFCLVKDGAAILSQHQGDLENAATFDDYRRSLDLYRTLFDHEPAALAVDRHPEYLSSKLGRDRADAEGLPLFEVQHHHAHVAACLAENGYPLGAAPVLGIALDGLGWGDDGTIWGGEFLFADYRRFERRGTFKPVAMPGGAQAVREPWRNLYAHLTSATDFGDVAARYAGLDLCADLAGRPLAILDAMMRQGLNAPLASSCGRLFDAVAGALGVSVDRQAYEGEAGALLEALVDQDLLASVDDARAYPFGIANLDDSGLPFIEPRAMWHAVLDDLSLKTPPALMAARFHKGLARAIVEMVRALAHHDDATGRGFDTVALSGGCFQNRVLFEDVHGRLEGEGFRVLSHTRVPANDGGLALGQAAIAAAHLVDPRKTNAMIGDTPCASASQAAS